MSHPETAVAEPARGGEPWTVLTKDVPWYGPATGYYGMLPRSLQESGVTCDAVAPRASFTTRLIGKCWAWRHGLPSRNQSLAFAERRFLQRFDARRSPGLMLALEDNLPLLGLKRFAAGAPLRLVGTIHYPPFYWTTEMQNRLRNLRSALVLYRADLEFFERLVGRGRVRFVSHGVDTERFAPAPRREAGQDATPPRFLVCGQFGRDYPALLEVYRRLSERHRGCVLDIVGVHHLREHAAVRGLAALPGCTVHGACSHEELVRLYQNATVMLLPLQACAANNALVEALSCGVPVVATDLGGVRDYGGGTIFPVTPPGDNEAMAAAVSQLVADPVRRRAMSTAAREYALRHLTWADAAAQHRAAVEELCAGDGRAEGRAR